MNVLIPVSALFSSLIFCVLSDQELLFITQNSIRKYDITSEKVTIPINDEDTTLYHLNDVDFDFELQIMFYLVDMKQIYSYNLITKEQKLIIKTDQEIPHIAVDWVTKKIYFSVSDRKRIIVCSYDGIIQKILFQRQLSSNLKAVCVSPKHGYLFFSDIGYDAKIERANMDGTNAIPLVTEHISMPVAIAIDPVDPIIYWIDVYEQTVEMIHMDGSNRKVIRDISTRPWGTISALVVLRSKIFFMGNPNANAEKQLNSGIISCNKVNNTLSNCSTVIKSKHHYASIKSYGKEYQPFMKSACALKNGPCSHLCLLKPRGYSCACPTGYKVNDDNKTCSTSFKKFIIFATKQDLRLISLDVEGRYDMTLPVKSQRRVTAVDYDPIDKIIYWTEVKPSEFGVIKRATLDGKVIEEVVSQGYTLPDHLAIDWVARNMYWTCPKFHKIYVSRLDGSSNMVVINNDLEQPRGIAVDPGDGRLYWSDWGNEKQKIESSDLDGSERKVLVDHDLQWPNGIALDYHNRHLYWVDAGTDKIEYYDLNKKTRNRLPKAGSPHAFGISILGEMLYWTDWQKRSLYQFNRETQQVTEIVDSVPDIMGIKAVDTTLQYGKNDCGNKNFECSHFCFHKPNHGAYCACPAGFHLSKDKKNCKAVTGFLLFATRTSIHALSLDKSPNSHQSSGSKVLDKDISHVETLTKSNRVYWVEDSVGGHRATAIKSVSLDKGRTKDVEYVQTGFSGLLGGIAIDWLAENIYWSQSKLHRIELSRLDGRFKRIVVNNTEAAITHIAVDPVKMRLYWFEEHNEGAMLMSSDLSGHDKKTLANATRNVFGLTVDVNESRVYWMLDNSLHSLTWDGRSEKVISITVGFPSGMKFFRNNIYICEQENSHSVALTISAVDTNNGKKSVLMVDQSKWCRDITVFHSSLQPGDNGCAENNGGCEQLCFATNLVNRTCQCESHYALNPADNKTCIPPNSFLLIGQKESVFRFEPLEQTNLALNLKTSATISMLACNILTNTLYWLEASVRNTIKYLYKNVVYTLNLQKANSNPQSFAIDFFSNVLYWSDRSDRSISFVHLDNSSRHGVIFKNERFQPTKITAFPEKGLLIFLNDMSSAPTKIESITMDGKILKTLHTFEETDTRCDIAVDHNNARVYWLHLEEKKIESVNLQGQERKLLMQFDKENFKPLTIAVYGKLIYWIDKKQKDSQVEYLKWRNIQKELNGIYSSKWEYDGSKDLHVVETDRLKVNHPCKKNNGRCSHICFSTTAQSPPKCGCPLGFGFLDEKRTQCGQRNNNTCANICNGRCMSADTWCDALIHCQLEEIGDLTCLCKKSSSYMCLDGSCIIKNEKFCDGFHDCIDNIDEDEKRCSDQDQTTTPIGNSLNLDDNVSKQPTKTYSHYTAGIVSGVILTVLVFTCVLYVICKLHHKKAALQKEEGKSFLQHTKFKTTTETAFVLTPKREENAMSDTYISGSLPRDTNFPIRYITGSSTNMTDSTVLPFNNPPPTIASNSMTSVNEYSNEDGMSQLSVELPAPPATPLYDPSDVESVLTTNDIDNPHGRPCKIMADRQHLLPCHRCAQQQNKQNYLYNNYSRRCSESCDSSSISSNYTPNITKRRPLYSKSTCSFESDSLCSSHKSFHSKPSSYHPPSLVSESISVYSNNTLPRMHHGASHRLVPSLASDMSRCSSETSVITVRQRDDLPKYSNNSGDSYYNNYAPPPSPGLEYTPEYAPELNDFNNFKDEEEEAIENDLLIESHRPQSTSEIF